MKLLLLCRKLYACALCAVISVSAFGQQSLWNADANTKWYTGDSKSYTISSAADLAGFAKLVNDGTYSFSGDTIRLGADIDLSAHMWVPVGKGDSTFKGCFDGGGYKIKGLKINGDNYSVIGFFSSIVANYRDNIVLKNITLSSENDSELYVGNMPQTPAYRIGALAGFVEVNNRGKILIEKCVNEISISGRESLSYASLGGLIGFISSDTKNCIDIVGCINRGDLTGSTQFSSFYIGGLIGSCDFVYDSYEDDMRVMIDNCHNYGVVAGVGTGGSYIGGLIGFNRSASLYRCSNQGEVTNSRISAISCTGGLIGNYDGGNGTYISNCYNSGDITGGGESSSRTGGLVGAAGGSFSEIRSISNCYNSGNIFSASGYFTSVYSTIGGLIGLSIIEISDCFVAVSSIGGIGDVYAVGNRISSMALDENYMYVGDISTNNKIINNGISWTGLMTFAPVNTWDSKVWIIDPTSRYLPKLNANDPDIPNPKYNEINDVSTGFSRIRNYNFFDKVYLGEIYENTIGINIVLEKDVFYLDTISKGRYLITLDCEENEKYTKGMFLFNNLDPEDGVSENYYTDNDVIYGSLAPVNAVRVGDALYIINNMEVKDISMLGELSKAGVVKKIDLKKTNNFIYSFLKHETGEDELKDAVSIESEAGGLVHIDDVTTKAKILPRAIPSVRFALFFIEPSAGNTTGNELTADEEVNVYASQGVLTIQSAAAENVMIYSVNGTMLMQVQKGVGEATYNVNLPKGVYIVKGSTGWVRKVIF